MSSIKKTLLTVLLPVFLQACVMQHQQVNSLAEQLDHSTPGATLLSLQSISPPARDRSQYLLNTGVLKSMTGDFEGAIEDLQNAKEILNSLQSISISGNLAAATINETLRDYDGSASERVLLHELLSINYLMLDDLDAARVEVLQAAVVMNELAREEKPVGQLASAHYIAGLVYELGGELDNARISYRKAANLMALRNMSLPRSLQNSQLAPRSRLGVNEGVEEVAVDEAVYQYHDQVFLPAVSPDPNAAEIIVIYWDGVVTSKRGTSTSVWVPSMNQVVSLALPHYPPSNYVQQSFTLNIAGRQHRTETIEDIEALLREDLDDESAAIYAMTLARMVSKRQFVKSANDQDPGLALFANIFTILTESADIRSWNMLPSTIQIGRFSLAAGEYSLPYPVNPESWPASPAESKLAVSPGEKVVLFVPGVSKRIFTFRQAPR
jgi:hypothetical protein